MEERLSDVEDREEEMYILVKENVKSNIHDDTNHPGNVRHP